MRGICNGLFGKCRPNSNFAEYPKGAFSFTVKVKRADLSALLCTLNRIRFRAPVIFQGA